MKSDAETVAGKLYRVVGNRFVAGFIVDEGRVIKTAPYLRRSLMGQTEATALHICWERGWKVEKL